MCVCAYLCRVLNLQRLLWRENYIILVNAYLIYRWQIPSHKVAFANPFYFGRSDSQLLNVMNLKDNIICTKRLIIFHSIEIVVLYKMGSFIQYLTENTNYNPSTGT